MPRQKNRNVVFTGTPKDAKRKLPASFGRTKRAPMKRERYTLVGGPLDGKTVLLFECGTLPIELNGQRGRYVGSTWEKE